MILNETFRTVKSIYDLTIMDDYMASRIFSDKKTVSEFLSIILGHPVNIVHCRKQVQVRPRKNAHYVIFDILAIDDHGNIYNIEIQNYDEKDFILRLTYNAGILISMALGKGKKYEELKHTNVIALCSSDPVGSGETCYDASYPFENYPDQKMKPVARMIALNARGKKSSGNMDIDLLMDYIKTNRRNNGRLTVLLDDARLKICNDEKEREAFMTELYQGQHAGDVIARKQVKEMKKEIERMKAESAQYKELYQGQKAGDEIARKQNEEMKKEIAQKQKKIEEMTKEAEKYKEEKKNSALKLYDDGMDIAKIAGILNTDPQQVNGWIVSENEASYDADDD